MIGGDRGRSERAALDLLDAAMGHSPDVREAYIASRDDLEPAIRERALELLLSDRDARASLRTGGAGAGLYGGDEVAPDIAGYRVIRQLGRGGMGSVWLAERNEGDFDHTVAIKVIRPGALSESLIERFRRERQILAKLNHPHIARLYDGGETEDGQPYIVMEYVAGRTLRQWLKDTPTPGLDARLDLFRQIKAAVGSAHQNLVVHRDLTPGNILVDHEDQAKLIDFGIARPPRADEQATPASRITGLSLTPGFAAPERMNGDATNTLSDIYSLGRILEAMLDGMAEPELTAIAAKAASDDPSDRYASVSDLSDDLERFRDGRTVDAYSSSRRYRINKFVRRQKTLVASVGIVLTTLAIGLAGTSWSYVRAEAARAEAEQRFGEVRELANFMLYDLYDDLASVTGNTRSLMKIADRASGYLDSLGETRTKDPGLKLEIANGLKRLSDVLGNPVDRNLGRREEAGVALRRSVALLEELHKENPADANVSRSLAQALFSWSVYRFIAEDLSEEAIGPARRSAALYDSLLKSGEGTRADELGRVEAKLQAAKPLVWIDEGEKAVVQMEALVPEVRALVRQDSADPVGRRTQARLLSSLASAMSWSIDLSTDRAEYLRSIPIAGEAIEALQNLHRRFPDDQGIERELMGAHFVRALIYWDIDSLDEAHRDLTASENHAMNLLDKDPDDSELFRRLQGFRGQHAPILVAMGRLDEAIAMARLALAERRKLVDAEPENAGYFRDRTSARRALGETLLAAGQRREGCAAYLLARAEWREIERRWGISPLNQANDVDTIDAGLLDCRGSGHLG
ncbi:protein kinase [Qipengyuania sp.]|uniref:serine/threonine-protein kinase n=1 Tax=Qipengyuania sp. TaxID=2004515 RepID=UPI0035C863B6